MAKSKKQKTEPLREGKVVETPDVNDNDTNIYTPDDSFLMPNDGESMSEEQKADDSQQLTKEQQMFANHELAQVVFDWLDDEIASCDSVQAALEIAKAYKVSKEEALISLDLCRKVFEGKKITFQDIYDTISTKK